MRLPKSARSPASLLVVAIGFTAGCGSRADLPIDARARCPVVIDDPRVLSALHVDSGTNVVYDSNPPSSGPHYAVWAAYQAYASPVPREYYVHDLEHGAVVLLYRCDADAGCADVARGLQAVADAIGDDPLCTGAGEGVRVRIVITPDPLLDVPIAAAAWGWTYKADCLDIPTLTLFAVEHYGRGRESLCLNGTTHF